MRMRGLVRVTVMGSAFGAVLPKVLKATNDCMNECRESDAAFDAK